MEPMLGLLFKEFNDPPRERLLEEEEGPEMVCVLMELPNEPRDENGEV